MVRIKICCIASIEEAKMAINCGASALGLVSKMPSGPGVIPEDLILEIAEKIPPGISSFLLTSLQNAGEIIQQQKRCRTNTIQLCDRLVEGTYIDFKNAMPGIKIVQVIHVTGEESIIEAQEVSKHVDAILLDSGNQKLAVKELGGTGKIHDWTISRKIVESIHIPVFLAGGLNPDNVINSIQQVRPFGVDICSGVRTNGKLDKAKLKQFAVNVNSV